MYSGIFGDQVDRERGLRDAVDNPAMEGKSAEQQKHAETNHDDGQRERSRNEDSHIDSEQHRHRDRCARVQHEKADADSGHRPDLLERERFHIPLICGNENEQVDESEHVVLPQSGSSGDEGRQSPEHQHGYRQGVVHAFAERAQPLRKEWQQSEEGHVCSNIPP